ncbi:MAG: lipopolysaccharide heptosyltransferase I [Pseudomonadota bacterium]
MPQSSALIVKTSSLGDVIHALPALTDICQHRPSTVVDWVVEESFSAIPALHPGINRVITCNIRQWRKSIWRSATRSAWKQFTTLLGVTHYDAIVDLQGLLKSGLLSTYAHGERHGYDAESIREPIASHFYHKKHTISRHIHAVERNRQLMAKALGYTIDTPPDYGIVAPREFERPFERLGGCEGAYVMLLPATSRAEKYWSIDHWNTLVRWLLSHKINMIILWGTAHERVLANALASPNPQRCHVPTERHNIHTLAGWIGHAQAVVGVDTGLMHLAAALNRFTVGIYGVTSPILAGPYPPSTERISLGGLEGFPSPHEVISHLKYIL